MKPTTDNTASSLIRKSKFRISAHFKKAAALGSLHARRTGHRLPASREALLEIRDLQRHAQRQLAQTSLVFDDEVNQLVNFDIAEVVVLKQGTRLGDLLDAQNLLASGVDGEVQVVAAAHQRIQVFSHLALDLVELDVGDKDHRTTEVERIRDAFVAQEVAFGQPADLTTLTAVQRTFEQVQRNFIEQCAVAIIKHQHAAGVAVLIQRGIQAHRSDAALDDLGANASALDLVEQLNLLDFAFDVKALAHAWRAGNNHRTDVTVHNSLGHVGKNVEALADTSHDLVVGLVSRRVVRVIGVSRGRNVVGAADHLVVTNSVDLDLDMLGEAREGAAIDHSDVVTLSTRTDLLDQLEHLADNRFTTIRTVLDANKSSHLLAPFEMFRLAQYLLYVFLDFCQVPKV